MGIFLALLVAGCMAAPSPSSQSTRGATPDRTAVVSPRSTGTPLLVPSDEPVPFPLEATIPELQDAMAAGELTSVELVDFYLARIQAYDESGPALNALIGVNRTARATAAHLDAEREASGPRSLLHGIPIVLKDNIDVVDMPTTAGSFALEGSQPADDAFVARRLRDAGAVILGKTNLPDFAFSWLTISSGGGQTLNPYDTGRDPAGSSGGTAVAVTANMAAAGLGSDTCGSIRLPSGLNGLFALRPTEGLVSRTGVVPLAPTLDVVGPMARSVVDVAILLDAIAGADPDDPTSVPSDASFLDAVDATGLVGRRVGTVSVSNVPAEVREVYAAAIGELAAGGSELVEVQLPVPTANVFEFFKEFGFAFDDYLASLPNPPVASAVELRERYRDAAIHPDRWPPEPAPSLEEPTYQSALAGRDALREAVVALMDEHDLDAIAYPASTGVAARIGGFVDPLNCETAAYGGLPALVVPAGVGPGGLPLGMELLGRPFSEASLISLAGGYEAVADHRWLPPTTPPAASAGSLVRGVALKQERLGWKLRAWLLSDLTR